MDPLDELARHARTGQMDRREFLRRALGLGLTLPIALGTLDGCTRRGPGSIQTGDLPPMSKDLPDKLNVFTWPQYSSPEVTERFERIFGIEVVERYFDDNEEMLSQMSAAPEDFDVVVPSDYMVSIMRRLGLARPLDMSLIPRFDNIMAQFRMPVFDRDSGGAKFSVPWQWGTSGIGVRLDKVDKPVRGWSAMWDQANAGQISMLDDERETIGVALQTLGYSISTLVQEEVDAATAKLVSQKPLVNRYDSLGTTESLRAGLALVHTWDGAAKAAIHELGEDVCTYILPEEGFTIWIDNLVIPRSAPSPYAAHLYINYLCEPQIAAELVNFTRYQTPNSAAAVLLGAFERRWMPSGAALERGEIMNDVGDFAGAYDAAWAEVQAS